MGPISLMQSLLHMVNKTYIIIFQSSKNVHQPDRKHFTEFWIFLMIILTWMRKTANVKSLRQELFISRWISIYVH